MDESHIKNALREWQQILPHGVLDKATAEKKYASNTIAATISILGALIPTHADEIVAIVKIANHHRIALYPFSTGHNWGYGGPSPVKENCVLVDLSQMNKILDYDATLGLVTLEPGVTQGQLKQFLDEQKSSFIVPVTGAGPTCSLLGNALERGYGLNPITDHFAAVMSINAVLADGSRYHGALTELGGTKIDRAYKWGIGPYLDGLFAQANMGIITSMTIALKQQSDETVTVLIGMESEAELINVIDDVRMILQELGGNLGSFTLTNQHRLAAFADLNHPKPNASILLDPEIDKLLSEKRFLPWAGTTCIYGNKAIVKAVKKVIKQRLKGKVKNIYFFNSRSFSRLKRIISWLPIINKNPHIQVILNKVETFLALRAGVPNQTALPIAYTKSGTLTKPPALLNPDEDGCGIIWFAPLIEMKSEQVQEYFNIVKSTLIEYQREPVMTLSSVSLYCFDSAIPILFDRNNPTDKKLAYDCYESLFHRCKEKGFIPYRLPVTFMHLVIDNAPQYFEYVKKIKNALDPENILSPGRYSKD